MPSHGWELGAGTGGCLDRGGVAAWRGEGTGGGGGRGVIAFAGLLLLPYTEIFLLKRRKIKSCYSREVNPFLPQATK